MSGFLLTNLRRIMRKQAFCVHGDQLHGELISTFVFATYYICGAIPLPPKFQSLYFYFKPLAIFCGSTGQFLSDL